ncbi:hypothetical protein AVEN_89111-1 [Araneus ventricosus]|uniref:Uncharacterized protein n=1 Tax=Araneus ventricosus TaxID=182803 RepID=A0A4Y2B4S2_ARAVE|nr:hypothetical protein AVEN_89111-1 [Araneus ventricosus]
MTVAAIAQVPRLSPSSHQRSRPDLSRRRYVLSPERGKSIPTIIAAPGETKTRLLIRWLLIYELVVTSRGTVRFERPDNINLNPYFSGLSRIIRVLFMKKVQRDN